MTHTVNRVREFHEAFGHPVATEPNPGNRKLRELRVKLIAEELCELCVALGVALTIQCDGTASQFLVTSVKDDADVDLVEAADALGDIDYVTQGANLVFGFPAERVLREIQRANMSKLGEDGKPIYREDGKILKGPNYTPPDIASIINGPEAAPVYATEAEMRDSDAPWPKSEVELTDYIDGLLKRPHDYGTSAYAMSLAATASFRYIASSLGCSGFQASCADLDFVRRTRLIKGPFILLRAEDSLFPTGGPEAALKHFLETDAAEWIKERAEKLLEGVEGVHPTVKQHWEKLAQEAPAKTE